MKPFPRARTCGACRSLSFLHLPCPFLLAQKMVFQTQPVSSILELGPASSRIGRKYIPAAHQISSVMFDYPREQHTPRRLRGPGRDLARSIEEEGFPQNAKPPHAKKTFHQNPCHESHLTPACLSKDTDFVASSARRHIAADHKDLLAPDFLPRSLTPPPSTRKKTVGAHTLMDHVATNRVLITDLQDEVKPPRFSVRVNIRGEDTLSASLQGVQQDKAGKQSRRRFFEIRR